MNTIKNKGLAKRRYITDYVIVFLLLCFAGNPLLYTERYLKLIFTVFLGFIFVYRRRKLDIQLTWVIVAVFLIIAFQGLIWGYKFFTFFSYSLIIVVLPYLALKNVGLRFLVLSAKVIYYLSIISLVLFLLQVFLPGFENILQLIAERTSSYNSSMLLREGLQRPSVGIYTISLAPVLHGEMMNVLRNSGMFYEPGAFAVFIVVAIVINIYKDDKPFSKENIVLLITLASTFSTAGIMATGVVYILYFYIIKGKNIKTLFLISLIGIPILIYVVQLPFMADKIEEEFTTQTTQSLNTKTVGRILGARKALLVLSRYPLTGRGMIEASRVKDLNSEEAAGYGYMKFFAEKGVLFSILFILFFIKGMKRIAFAFTTNNKYWILLGGSLVINLFAQKFIGDAFFIMFFFIGLLNEFSIESLKKISYVR